MSERTCLHINKERKGSHPAEQIFRRSGSFFGTMSSSKTGPVVPERALLRNVMNRSALTVAVLFWGFVAAPATAQPSAAPRLAQWMTMKGCWKIEGNELSNRVDTFRQTGIGRIWVQDSSRIRVDRRLTIEDATGALAALPRHRQFSEVYYEIAPGRIVAEEADAAVPSSTRRTVLLSPKGDAIFSTFLANNATFGVGTVNTILWRLVSPDRIESETRARDPHGAFWSDYAQVWMRLPSSDSRCQRGS